MHSMKNYQKGGARGFKGDKGGRPSFKPGFKNKYEDRGAGREMSSFKAVCSECSKGCDVPFKPSQDKPVYCRDCFSAKRDRETKEYRASPAFTAGKNFSNERPETTSHKVMQHEHVRTPLPVQGFDETKKQLADISFKLDKLIATLEKMNEVKPQVIAALVAAKKKAPQVAPKPASSVEKVAPKKVAAKKVEVKKVIKSVPAKKVEVKKVVAKSAVKKVAEVKKTAPKKVAAKKTK